MKPRHTPLYPARDGERSLSPEILWSVPRVASPVAAPDGQSCAVTVTTYDVETNQGTSRIWIVPLSGEPRPITSPDSGASRPTFSPDGSKLGFLRKDGNGRLQVHVLDLGGGEAEKVTDLPLGAFDLKWLPQGGGLVVGGWLLKGHLTIDDTRTERDRRKDDPVVAHVTEERVYRYWDRWLTSGEIPHLFTLDLVSRELVDLMPESTAWFELDEPAGQFDVSPDGGEVAWIAGELDPDTTLLTSRLHVCALEGRRPAGPVRCLTPDHPADIHRARYTPDGKALIYGRQEDPFFYADRIRLMAIDRQTQEHVPLLTDWKLSPAGWELAADDTVFFRADDDARASLFGFKGTGDPWRVVAGGAVGGVSPAGRRVFLTLETLQQPAELYSCRRDGSDLTRHTHFTDESLAGVRMGAVRDYRYEGAAGATIQMYVVLPPDHREGDKLPLVQVIHGGPHGISADCFHYRWNAQLFAASGRAVAMVNFHGSTSWGQDFAKSIHGSWAEKPFEDIMNGTDALIEEGLADPDRMAAAGGSYGGYMAAWICGHTDRFRCIVNHAGVFDTSTQYASDITQGRSHAFGGEPWEGLERVDSTNPVRFSSGFTTPMMVIHGQQDFRVPADQGLECYGILKAKGVPARLVYFPDENHWVLKPRNSLLWYQEVENWIARFCG